MQVSAGQAALARLEGCQVGSAGRDLVWVRNASVDRKRVRRKDRARRLSFST